MNSNLELLLKRHGQANKKWLRACKSRDYPPDETKPLTRAQKQALRWAIVWRRAVHNLEELMLKHPDVIRGLMEGLTQGGTAGVAYFEVLAPSSKPPVW